MVCEQNEDVGKIISDDWIKSKPIYMMAMMIFDVKQKQCPPFILAIPMYISRRATHKSPYSIYCYIHGNCVYY